MRDSFNRRWPGVVAAGLVLAAATACGAPVAVPSAPAALIEAPTALPTQSATPGATPEDFGAVGDGRSDDTEALQAAVAALAPGETLTLPAGKVYRHSQVLTVATPDITLAGTGTLLATDEEQSAVYLAADGITVDGPTFAMADTTGRWVAFEQMKLRLGRFVGITVRNVVIDGSAAAGIYVGGASDFTIAGVTVRNTRADGIHMTGGSHGGTVSDSQITAPGDDGVAVVSYRNDSRPVSDITVTATHVADQVWGRGFSVVGGERITYRGVSATTTAGAAVYIAAEAEFDTYGVADVLVEDAELVNANQQADTDATQRPSPAEGQVIHGAVTVYNSQSDASIVGVTMRNLRIAETNPDAANQVLLRNTSSGSLTGITLEGVAISEGALDDLAVSGVPESAYRTADWSMAGQALPDYPEG